MTALEGDGAVIGDVVLRSETCSIPQIPEEDQPPVPAGQPAAPQHPARRSSSDQLLFKPGDRYSRHALDESERLLRQNRYLYDVKIRPRALRRRPGRPGGGDPRRLDPQRRRRASAAAAARARPISQIQDTNLLGTGKSLTLRTPASVDRTTSLFRYDDPAVLGSRARLGLEYEDNSDGSLPEPGRRPALLLARHPLVRLPHALDRRSWTRLVPARARRPTGFHHQQDCSRSTAASRRVWSTAGPTAGRGGFTLQRDRFEEPRVRGAGVAARRPHAGLSLDRLGLRSRTTSTEARDLDQIERTEDLQLGSQLHLRLGWSSPRFGGDRERGGLRRRRRHRLEPTPAQTLLLSSDLAGRWGSDGAENLLLQRQRPLLLARLRRAPLLRTLEGAWRTARPRQASSSWAATAACAAIRCATRTATAGSSSPSSSASSPTTTPSTSSMWAARPSSTPAAPGELRGAEPRLAARHRLRPAPVLQPLGPGQRGPPRPRVPAGRRPAIQSMQWLVKTKASF